MKGLSSHPYEIKKLKIFTSKNYIKKGYIIRIYKLMI